MIGTEADAAEAMRQRLKSDLRAAMKVRQAREVSVLRCLIAAIDNAGAVPVTPGLEPVRQEVERRRLGHSEVQTLLQHERELREDAAGEFARLGLAAEARRAEQEAAVVERYLARR